MECLHFPSRTGQLAMQDGFQGVRFQLLGYLYQFFCLCFGLEPALRIITKLLSNPTALLRRFMVKLQTSHIRMTYE